MTRSGASVHPTAVIHPEATLNSGVEVGPYAIVGPGVSIDNGTSLGPHTVVVRDTIIGPNCSISANTVLGADPQDLKYEGEYSQLCIGSGTTIREFASLNRGTAASGVTKVGNECLIMAYAHVAHDCVLGDGVVVANAVNMGGHVNIEDHATIGGLTAIHQFVRIGRHSFCGGGSRLTQDIPPFMKVAGNPVKLYGLNSVGLSRSKLSKQVLTCLRGAYQDLFQSKMNIGQALEKLEKQNDLASEVVELIEFIRSSTRGIVT